MSIQKTLPRRRVAQYCPFLVKNTQPGTARWCPMPANAEIAALRDLGLSEPEITNYLNLTTADKSWQTAICAHRCALHYKFDAPPVDEHTAANNAWDAAI